MTSAEIRRKYLEFFAAKGHAVIPSASLIPENDPTVLFTTAGMHPLVPYLLGEPHPAGRRLASAQKCIRTGDIEDVGDNRHLTFFEMLGNWSLGDYFKDESIAWSFEFLTGREWLGLDPARLYVTVFEGDSDAPRDEEAIRVWTGLFAAAGIRADIGGRIFAYPKADNWWPAAGVPGPCGPDTEMFYDIAGYGDPKRHLDGSVREGDCQPSCGCGRYVEVWNNVFMQYARSADGRIDPLAQRNVDTGMGLERMAMVTQGKPTVFETDCFSPLIAEIERLSGRTYGPAESDCQPFRVIADHIRAAAFLMGDRRGVMPSNVDQGYVLRRLIRRAVRCGRQIGLPLGFASALAEAVIVQYREAYPELQENRERTLSGLRAEEEKFSRTLERGEKECQRLLCAEGQADDCRKISGREAFYLYESFGFPMELTEEVSGRQVNREEWQEEMSRHQELSRAGSEQRFGSGLADHSEKVVRLHTATHLLHQALREVLGPHVEQKGSNITAERLRFDFSHPEKMTDAEKSAVEGLVNRKIGEALPVACRTMGVREAKESGAIGLFDDKYEGLGGQVKVYSVGSSGGGEFSREICSGPHVENTAELGVFRLKKEEASSSGVRRIKAVLE